MTLGAEIRRRLGPAPALSDWPHVSAVVLNRNGVAHLRRLLDGLVERTDYPRLQLVVVDNGSSDGSLEFLRAVDAPFPITVLANDRNESFSAGCNQGAAASSGELLLFLNNDVEPVEPGWLRELVACMRHQVAAAVGATLIGHPEASSADGYRVEQRGHWIGIADGMLVPVLRDRGEDPLRLLGEDVQVGLLAAACLLVARDAFDAVGGFTEGYWYGGEDSDLALKLREHGLGAVCSGRSLVVHGPSSTLNVVPRSRRSEWVRGNRRLFMERWGPRVRREYELDRLRGGGLWAEPGPAGTSSWGSTPAEVEALGFCLMSLGEGQPPLEDEPSLEALCAALRDAGRRATVLRGPDEVESLVAYDYDVAVRFGGGWREPSAPSQLHLRRPPAGHPSEPAAGSAEQRAKWMIAAAEDLARARGFRHRVAPGP
ncbi:MAG TPA: glycosyltransferase [Solirubrobacterales bacterium]|nr:glycosyltransferase [Solirubrobacterales bacterium]